MRARHYSLCSTLHAGGEDSGCIVGNWEVDFWFAVCCRSARIRRSHDLTVIVDELCNR